MLDYPEHWTDISDFVVHFTRGGLGADDLDSIFGIYAEGVLRPQKAFGIGRNICPDIESQRAVCFSEIPPGEWGRLEERRETKYGIGFRKEFLVSKGGGPIWYVWNESPQWFALRSLMKGASTDANADIWKLTPLIDAPGNYGQSHYFFEWEREWRHIREFAFEPNDVAFLLIPEDKHAQAREFFEQIHKENIGPAYLCPYIDPGWDRDAVIAAISATQSKA